MHSGFFQTPLDLLLGDLGARSLVLTGIAGNICVLITAHDAHMRGYHLVVPSDCIASNTVEDNDFALRQMATVLDASVAPSTDIDFPALIRASEALDCLRNPEEHPPVGEHT